jgi:hypothetical protein
MLHRFGEGAAVAAATMQREGGSAVRVFGGADVSPEARAAALPCAAGPADQAAAVASSYGRRPAPPLCGIVLCDVICSSAEGAL